MRKLGRSGFGPLAVMAGVILWLPGIAQEASESSAESETDIAEAEDTADASDEDATVEEIIVVAPRPGSGRDVPVEYEDPMRARLLRELYSSQEDQAELARMAADAEENEGRVRFGYNPNRDRPDLEEEMQTPQRETTRPATIFSIEF